MLLTADNNTTFSARIVQDDSRIWASYVVEGRVNGDSARQSDRRMFASEEAARNWLVGEGEQRGLRDVEIKVGPDSNLPNG